jgi:hypothetical protein
VKFPIAAKRNRSEQLAQSIQHSIEILPQEDSEWRVRIWAYWKPWRSSVSAREKFPLPVLAAYHTLRAILALRPEPVREPLPPPKVSQLRR